VKNNVENTTLVTDSSEVREDRHDHTRTSTPNPNEVQLESVNDRLDSKLTESDCSLASPTFPISEPLNRSRERKKQQDADYIEAINMLKKQTDEISEVYDKKPQTIWRDMGYGKKSVPKFRNPNDESQVWSGKGKNPPDWYGENLDAGIEAYEMLNPENPSYDKHLRKMLDENSE